VLLTCPTAPSPRTAGAPFGNPAEGTAKQTPGEDILGGWDEAPLGSHSGSLWFKDWPAHLPFMQGHSSRAEILTENELSGQKAAMFTGTLLPR